MSLKVTFAVLKLYNTHNLWIHFNYDVFTRKLESEHGLWFKLYYVKRRSSQGHGQSRTLQKWYCYVGNSDSLEMM